jgi:3-hydroxyacyl-CoA dehydrogenase
MARKVEKVCVLGAGVMGSGIAAHFANAGFPVVLLDIVPPDLKEEEKQDKKARNRLALNGIENALNFKPAPLFYSASFKDLITVGNFEDDFEKVGECDLIIEAVVENLEIKRKLFERVEQYMKWGAIVSSNTSGLSIKAMTEGRGSEFKRNFLVTHFFNPVRFMKLLEIVPGEETDQEVIDTWVKIGRDRLGKGIVFGKDTPNFIANRIGVYGLMKVIHLMIQDGYTIEEVDAIFGPPMGRPKSAAFGTCDLVGIDTFAHVTKNCYDSLPNDDERDVFILPEFVQKMIEMKLLGNKTKAGFYKKSESGERLVLDYNTLQYRPLIKPDFDSIKATKGVDNPKDKLVNLLNTDDRGSKLAWKATAHTLIYAAKRIGEIADDIVNIDNAMKWGFNWELGPFEVWDAIGVRESVEKMESEGFKVPEIVKRVLTEGEGTFYKKEGAQRYYFDFATGTYKPLVLPETVIILGDLKEQGKVIKENFGASLIDIGDNVACLEFHTKMNAIDDDIIRMIHEAADEVEANFEGLVIANHAENFSVGANLGLILMMAQMGNFEQLREVVKQFQSANMRLKYLKRPVVTCPAGMTLGGGCEVAMHGARIQAAAETYIGLVEIGAGVLPAGGGCKEMLVRVLSGVPADMKINRMPFIQKAFECIAMAKVSKSAEEAKELGYLRPFDGVSLNRDNQIYEAKQVVLGLSRAGYRPPLPPQNLILPGREGFALLKLGLWTFGLSGYVTEHDKVCAEKIAWVLCGGDIEPNTKVTEEYLLELECEGFLSLAGMEKSQARMEALLKTGKPLRN